MRRLTDGLGVDVAIECGGRAEAIGDSIAATRKGGTIVLLAVIGVPIPVNTWPIVEGERTVVGSVQHHFDEDLPVAVLSPGLGAGERPPTHHAADLPGAGRAGRLRGPAVGRLGHQGPRLDAGDDIA